jgi:hypothetical protein
MTTDRRGVTDPNPGLGIKAPVRCATTAAITLSGLQVIDGVQTLANDRVLVWNQADKTTNGIYLAQSGAWLRASDFDATGETIRGTLVRVPAGNGAVNGGRIFELTTTDTPVNIGASQIVFAVVTLGNTTPWLFSGVETTKTGNFGITDADLRMIIPLGGNTAFTVSVPAVNTLQDANFACLFINIDTGAMKTMSINGLAAFTLQPLNWCFIQAIAGNWYTFP